MSLVIQLLGCAGAAVVIALLVHGDATRSTVAVSTAVLGAVVVSLLGLQGLWPTAKRHIDTAAQQRRLTPAQVRMGGGRQIGLNADFVEWAATQAQPRDRFYLLPRNDTVMQWLSYRMLPRLADGRPRKGTVLVFYNTTPRKQGYGRSNLTDVRIFQPRFSIARVKEPKSR
jgi:hypothetical protein